ncbi:hypothetical protein RO3G_05009 [Rhizopus delemar RA 99-880]|uniref:Uncharacterized protein n=1 Tax=Rhizopus delemar (strain RA 99-880 / ATCC MYA-4621 / FGSC 9543 / NRRL 43880) TaxID=246409 RepID=I1BVS4_RHIO9|nr:hypothetical protein RO3G_05009 [Rhizopus delemar RA 99-880]|eukprot:EIE80304.1 hypothetical protein RO3G_05009 [Rhizopus delemar RA 99-880]
MIEERYEKHCAATARKQGKENMITYVCFWGEVPAVILALKQIHGKDHDIRVSVTGSLKFLIQIP